MQTTPKVNISIFDIILKKREIKIDFFKENKDKFGYFFKFQVLDRKILVCTHPEGIKHILVDNNKNYNKSFAYDIIKLFLGNGLLTSEGEFWKKQRRLAQPAFHKQKLDLMFQNMIEETKSTINDLQKYADKDEEINSTCEQLQDQINLIFCCFLMSYSLYKLYFSNIFFINI